MQCLSSPKVQFVGLILVILCDFKANSEFFGFAGASMQMAATLFDLRELMSRTKTANEIQCLVFLMVMEMGREVSRVATTLDDVAEGRGFETHSSPIRSTQPSFARWR